MNIRKFGQVNNLTNQPIGLDVGAGINTGDATATAATIAAGFTAYGPLGKITGNGANAKNFASGNITSSSGTLTFTLSTGATTPSNYVTVPFASIGFIPYYIELTNGTLDTVVYNQNYLNTDVNAKIVINGAIWRATGNAYVNGTGFQLPTQYASTVYAWRAYGA